MKTLSPTISRSRRPSRSTKKAKSRLGTVSVEMAFCMPILFLMFMASIDLIRYNLLRNVVTQSTYEGARAALVRGATVTDVQDSVRETMVAFNPGLDFTVAVTPTTLPSTSETITVTVICDLTGEGWIVTGNLLGKTMSDTMILKNL